MSLAMAFAGCGAWVDPAADLSQRELALESAPCRATRPDVTNGVVRSLAGEGDVVYLAGDFTYVGEPTGPWAALLDGSEARDTRLPEIGGGDVRAVIRDGAGGYYGLFNSVGGEPRLNFAAVDLASGAPLPLTVHVGERVDVLARDEGRLLVGGAFTSLGGALRPGLAAVDRDTGKLLPWAPELIGNPEAIAVAGDRVIVGGAFNSQGLDLEEFCGRTPLHGLAAFDRQTAARLPFPPSFDYSVHRLLATESTLYTGSLSYPLVAIDLETTSVRPLLDEYQSNPPPFAVDGDAVYIGNVSRGAARLLRLDAGSGAVDAEFSVSFGEGELTALAIDAGVAYLAGAFQTVNGVSRRNFAAVSLPSGTLTDWDPGARGATPPVAVLRDVVIGDGQLFVGGDFTSLLGEARDHVASIDLATGSLTPFAPQVDRGDARAARYPLRVNDLAFAGGQLHVAGDFHSVGSTDRSGWASFCAGGAR